MTQVKITHYCQVISNSKRLGITQMPNSRINYSTHTHTRQLKIMYMIKKGYLWGILWSDLKKEECTESIFYIRTGDRGKNKIYTSGPPNTESIWKINKKKKQLFFKKLGQRWMWQGGEQNEISLWDRVFVEMHYLLFYIIKFIS